MAESGSARRGMAAGLGPAGWAEPESPVSGAAGLAPAGWVGPEGAALGAAGLGPAGWVAPGGAVPGAAGLMEAGPAAMMPGGFTEAGAQGGGMAARPAALGAPRGAERSGPIQGDVFLDGARVGRWMEDALSRRAGRPPSGPTGFDPRRGAAWPGAAVGF
jgi:hypothetical protein